MQASSAFDGTAILSDTDIANRCDTYVVVVETPQGNTTRRVMLSLHSAEKAVHRAWDAGQPAWLVLAKLTPVSVPLSEQEAPTWEAA